MNWDETNLVYPPWSQEDIKALSKKISEHLGGTEDPQNEDDMVIIMDGDNHFATINLTYCDVKGQALLSDGVHCRYPMKEEIYWGDVYTGYWLTIQDRDYDVIIRDEQTLLQILHVLRFALVNEDEE